MTTPPAAPGRTAQRRRTRRAIVEAAMALLSEGAEPSINEIAVRADVSRRTVYLHFPTLDQLLLDATLGLLNADVDAALEAVASTDPHRRLEVLIEELFRSMEQSLPMGRKLIKLTVDLPAPQPGQPRRGFRRIGWLEWALEPTRAALSPQAFEQLVSSLALVIGWESFIVLLDVRGLTPGEAQDLTVWTAGVLVDAALAEAEPAGAPAVRA